MINCPSLANIPFTEFSTQLEELVNAGVKYFHIDIMDGHYVKNLCFPVSLINDCKAKYPDVKLDVHLMVDDPLSYIPQMIQAKADYVSFHQDSTIYLRKGLCQLQEAGIKAGIAINPSQRIDVLEPILPYVDYILQMTVEPGFAGQHYLPGSTERLIELSQMRRDMRLDFQIFLDGGISYDNLKEIAENGADLIVTNVFTIFNQPEGIAGACRKFEEKCREYGSTKK
ncbi:MAG TPA: ribulose-phosphate 3-epimerase [Clostridiaceae bacterium]|jgi:ribulose-phosphate 3-epimerase|nr:ribulose-phosphate 3-epimerase [Clostridiaceae bacterium]